MNINYEYIGYCGAFFISIFLIPQIYHIYTIKNADGFSIYSIILNIIASILMFTYAICIEKYPIVITNGMVCLFYIIICYLKYIYKNNSYSSNINNDDKI
jgi:uncharacterized protein with PQ loop repeat